MKVLIISHNPMSPVHSIGKTLMSLFSQFSREELCQLYIHPGVPVEQKCMSYYQITDKDALMGLFCRKVHSKETFPTENIPYTADGNTFIDKNIYGSKKNRKPYRELVRDIVWKMSPWYTKELKNWIEREKPSHVFVAIGSGKFLYDIAVKISKDYSIPLITYVCDDFYTMDIPKEPFGTVWKKQLEKSTKKLMKQTKRIVSICDEMTEYYGREFQRKAITVMTGTNYRVADEPCVKKRIQNLCYYGKLSLNRYKSMADIGRTVDAINESRQEDTSIEIYCGGVTPQIEKEFEGIRCCHFHNFISGSQFEKTFFESDALIHVEAFDSESVDRVKNSISTKIADSLASGIPLLAYAPSHIASMQYLIRNDCAFVATDKDELMQKVELLLSDEPVRETVSQNAIATAKKYHDPQNVSNNLYCFIESIK